MKTGRTKNVLLNSFWAIFSQIVLSIVNLLSNKIFLSYLGEELFGVNSLFTDLITIFSFADFGFGTAISFSLYEPIANNDIKRIREILRFYRKIIFAIAAVLLIIGGLYLPSLKYIKTNISLSELKLYYLIFIVNCVLEYLFAFRESYITARQEIRVLTIFNMIVFTLKAIIQIIVVMLYKNFIAYLIINTMSIIVRKFGENKYIKRKYQETITSKCDVINNEEKNKLCKNAFALFIQKIGDIVIGKSGSLIISYYIGVSELGLLTNYILLKNAINSIMSKFYSIVLPSFGNLLTDKNIKKEKELFYIYDFFNKWISMFCFVGLSCLSKQFISIFFGEKYSMSNIVLFAMYFSFYIDQLRLPISMYREASGIYEKDKWWTIVAAIVSVFVSIMLIDLVGICSIYIGYIFASIILHIFRSKNVFNNIYNESVTKYLFNMIISMFVCLICFFITKSVCDLLVNINMNIYITFILSIICVVILPNIIFVIINIRNKHLKEILTRIKMIIAK